MRVLLVVAHPLDNAFAKAAAARIRATLERRGIEVDILTGAERRGYFTTPYDSKAVAGYVARLRLAEKLVFVFPQWWFNVPAILKGFFDRVLVPGVAFDHVSGGGPLIPRLTHIDALWVVSSTGAPWWVTRLYMGDPVRRQIARSIKPLVSRKASFRHRARAGPIWGSKASELRESCLSDGSAATANQGTTLDVPPGSSAITPALHFRRRG